MSLETSASESEEKDVNQCMFVGEMCLTDCGVKNCALMVLILLMKNLTKSSAFRDDGGEEEDKAIQFKFICIALFTIQIIAKQLYRKLSFYNI